LRSRWVKFRNKSAPAPVADSFAFWNLGS
jgi:hypothetical protein